MAPELDVVYTLKQAAELLKVSPWTLRRWINNGQVHAFKLGRQWRITAKELQRRLREPLREPHDRTD